MSTAGVVESPRDGGRVTKPGATFVRAPSWASRTERLVCGRGGCTPTSQVTVTISWPRAALAGRKHSTSRAAVCRPGGQDRGRSADHRSQPLLGCVRHHPRPARPGRPVPRLCRARWTVDVLRCGWPSAFEVLADRPASRPGAEIWQTPAELRADRVRSLPAVDPDLHGDDTGLGECGWPGCL